MTTKSRPGATLQEVENEMVAKAVRLARKKLDDETASSQIIMHYLDLGSEKSQLQKEKMEKEIKLLEAKVESLKSIEDVASKIDAAMSAFKRYHGDGDSDEEL